MFFHNRAQAGQKLTEALLKYKENPEVVVLGLPRGGVVTAYEVAKALTVPLDVVITKKLGAPGNPEYAIGAIAETGEVSINEEVVRTYGISPEYIQQEVQAQKEKIRRYAEEFRNGKKLADLEGKIAILIDDGIATGYTMLAAVEAVRSQKPEKIVVAIPVSPPDSLEKLKKVADEVICLATPAMFMSVGQFYQEFAQTTDEEVKHLLSEAKNSRSFALNSC